MGHTVLVFGVDVKHPFVERAFRFGLDGEHSFVAR
jgi:hypothetical protein